MGLTNNKNSLPLSAISPEVIEGWKVKHGNVYQITTEGKTGYFRELTKRDFLPHNHKKIMGKNHRQTCFNIIKATWLGGDNEFVTDADFMTAAVNQLEPVFQQNIKEYNSKF